MSILEYIRTNFGTVESELEQFKLKIMFKE